MCNSSRNHDYRFLSLCMQQGLLWQVASLHEASRSQHDAFRCKLLAYALTCIDALCWDGTEILEQAPDGSDSCMQRASGTVESGTYFARCAMKYGPWTMVHMVSACRMQWGCVRELRILSILNSDLAIMHFRRAGASSTYQP